MLREYSDRYVICESKDEFLFKWASYTGYKLPDMLKAYSAVYADYNPLENYSKHESGVKVITDGDTTRTHSPDSEHNTTVTTTSYNTYTENEQGAGADQPKTEHYVSTFDSGTRLESTDQSSGKTTTHQYTDDDTNTTVTDDRAYSDTESHSTITTTWDSTSYTGDRVEAHKNDISGLNNKSNQELIQDSISIANQSLIYAFIYEFIAKYTYYAAGGDNYYEV